QGCERLAGIGREHHLGLLGSVGHDLRASAQLDLEAGALQTQSLELGSDRGLHPLRRRLPELRQARRRLLQVVTPEITLALGRRMGCADVLRGAELDLEPRALLDRRLDRSAVLALDAVEDAQPGLDRLQATGIGLE